MIAAITTFLLGTALLPVAAVLFVAWRLLRGRLLNRRTVAGSQNP
jgi:hypothetical protein